MGNWLKPTLFYSLCALTLLATACQTFYSGTSGNGCYESLGEPEYVPMRPHLGKVPSMMALGRDLDHLEKHIDWFGSATPKVPDIWGQARLTLYREQFEEGMAAEINRFEPGLQGALARSDQAFLATATALSMASQPKPPLIGNVTSTQAAPATQSPTSRDAITVTENEDKKGKDQGTGKPTSSTEAKPTPKEPLPSPDLTKEIGDFKDTIKRTEVKLERIGFEKNLKAGGVGIEPTLVLAQKKRYLDFLNQLRRENEGDDTADSPGYSLNLVRVPVSLLPGSRTDVGFGAEVTMTLTPILGDDLLPTTFRRFVINDLVHQLGFPLALFLDDERRAKPEERFLNEDVQNFLQRLEANNNAGTEKDFEKLIKNKKCDTINGSNNNNNEGQVANQTIRGLLETNKALQRNTGPAGSVRQNSPLFEDGVAPNSEIVANWTKNRVILPRLSFSNALNARTPFPTSQMLDIYGLRFTFESAFGARQALGEESDKVGYVHLPDVQSYLREELQAAYQFLAHPENCHLWEMFCTQRMVAAVRSQRWDELLEMRRKYRDEVMRLTNSKPLYKTKLDGGIDYEECQVKEDGKVLNLKTVKGNPVKDTRQVSVTSALGWCILVDAALLTDRLILDMRNTASAKNRRLPGGEHWHAFYLPDPPSDCRKAFNDYVALRWPVHVFALDPYTQDQNVADALSSRRETQLALSIAFTNGSINAQNLTRYARRLEAEYEAIALNRTQIGFSHGENVFGWRFYPRFQTPETPSNVQALFREQLIGGPNRDQLLRERRLEPGPRECVAVVMMPSFVPYAELDSVTNWFPLSNPKHKVLDHTQALRLSRTVQSIKMDGFGVIDAVDYRAGEVSRMLRRVEQLEARLPTQTLISPMPILNTMGGFEMFSNGTTDLAPELFGWYGAPGVNRDTETVLFLAGDHFSPLRTEVIAGNKKAKHKLLSRQVLQLKIPAGSIPVQENEIRVHLATPYGITRELSIPVINDTKGQSSQEEGYYFDPLNNGNKLKIGYQIEAGPPGQFKPIFSKAITENLQLHWKDESGSVPQKVRLTFKFSFQGVPITIPCDSELEISATGKQFTLDNRMLELIGKELVDRIGASIGPMPLANNPLEKPLPALTVEVTPVSDTHAVQPVKAANPIVVYFKPEAICLPAPFKTPDLNKKPKR